MLFEVYAISAAINTANTANYLLSHLTPYPPSSRGFH